MQNMGVKKVNENWKGLVLLFIEDILKLKVWKNENSPIFYQKSIEDYFQDESMYKKLKEDEKFTLLFETLELYSNALDGDWLPPKIIGLDINQAHIFLKEIKNILRDFSNEGIENKLIDRYQKIN